MVGSRWPLPSLPALVALCDVILSTYTFATNQELTAITCGSRRGRASLPGWICDWRRTPCALRPGAYYWLMP
ncbi:hypothetical protein ACFQ93_23515 [Streptomyces sp. NPDC056601]|uniref:hypothetical protein n=1 Tax=Streptomyces sp. NPDC056601 TaxID=3345875 RepID=UPI0036A1321E